MRRTRMLILAGTIAAPSAVTAAETPRVAVEISGYVPTSCRATSSATPSWQCNSPAELVPVESSEVETADGAGDNEPRRVTVLPRA